MYIKKMLVWQSKYRNKIKCKINNCIKKITAENKQGLSSGFTLMEIIAVVSLFTLVILVIGSIFLLAQKTQKRGVNQSEIIQNARVALDRLSRELRQAEDLVTDVITATSTDIEFQDGHDTTEISYIKYYLDDTDIRRAELYYYFAVDPGTRVYYNSLDIFSNPPLISTSTNVIVGEYFDSLGFLGSNGLVNVFLNLSKNSSDLFIRTKVYIRNW